MTPAISKHDAAISYKKERRAAVKHLTAVLEAFGFSVWWDDELRAGYRYDPQIDDAFANAGALIVLWCSLSVKSAWVASEALLADKRDGNIVPVLMENISATTLPVRLADLETIPLHRWRGDWHDEWLDKLLCEIEMRAGRARKADVAVLDRLTAVWRAANYQSLADFPLENHSPAKTEQTASAETTRIPKGTSVGRDLNVVKIETAHIVTIGGKHGGKT